MLNINGELMGINVAIYEDAQNIGFAVPIKRVKALLAHWMTPRIISKTWPGFEAEDTNCLQNSQGANAVGVSGIFGCFKTDRNVTHGSEIVDFVGPNLLDDANKVGGVR